MSIDPLGGMAASATRPGLNRLHLSHVNLTPLRITLLYLVFGMAALVISDVLFVRYLSEPLLSQVQALKGGAEVLLTAGLIFVLTNHREGQLAQERRDITQQRKELSVLHRVLRHNIRNDINVILGRTEMIRTQVSDDQLDAHCAKILEKVDELAQYTEQAALIRKTTENLDRTGTLDLSRAIASIIDDHPLISTETDVSLTLPEQATVEANTQLPEAIKELVTNAIKHTDAETPLVAIEVRREQVRQGMVEIRISDNGPGIPLAEREAIRGGIEAPLQHPSGMGLWSVKWAVDNSGGEIAFEDREPTGTTVVIRVPQAQ